MVKGDKTSRLNNDGDPPMIVTAQQSRFDSATESKAANREIIVKDLNIAIGNRELLSHAEVHLQPGRHYILVGRNGTGKTTFLRALATAQIPGIPSSIRVLLLGQVQTEDESPNDQSKETVLQHVIRSDQLRERLLDESRRLSSALEITDDPSAIIRTYREIKLEREERQLFEARRVATRMSGARGMKARKTVIRLEDVVSECQAKLKELSLSTDRTLDASAFGEETRLACDLLADIQASLESMNASATESKARSILLGLGFTATSLESPLSHLSGGWKTRCNLACALCQSTDLLLLDEPTNFLDLPSIIWLERYVQELTDTTVIVVTHDRAFADSTGEELLVLRELTLERFRGSLSGYEVDRLKTQKYLGRMKDAQEKQKKHMQASIDSNLKAAKRTGDDKKLKQAASRKKKLDERMGMEVSAKGTRFKLNRDRGGFHTSLRDEIDVPKFDPLPRITLPISPSDLRFPGALISFEKVTFGYREHGKETLLLRDIDFTIHPGQRVGLAGLNGSGKSTMVNLAMGGEEGASTSAIKPKHGTITRHTRARIGRYSQHSVEELTALALAQPEITALGHLMEFCGPSLSEKEARGLLAGIGLSGKVTEVPVGLLSGGQLVRLALAKLIHVPPHLLILDEVTTHLDADTIQALALAFRRYEGAIWLITHDRFFMRCVIEGASPRALLGRDRGDEDEGDYEDEEDNDSSEDDAAAPGVVYQLSKGKLTELARGMSEYEEKANKKLTKLGKT